MSSNPVNGSFPAESRPGGRPGTRYSTLARLLIEEIQAGRYKVGEMIPTEAELQQRFDVSRHTVREALRDLKTQGLLTARAGVGTVVRASAPPERFVQGVGGLQDLVQFAEAVRMKVLRRRVLLADESLAARIGAKAGQEWHEAHVLRSLPKAAAPLAVMSIYVRPEFAEVLGLIEDARQPVYSLIERRHGVRIVEVRQQICAVALDRADARLLKTRSGAPALNIRRQYLDSHDRPLMASDGLYPSDRFSHDTSFRVHPAEERQTA